MDFKPMLKFLKELSSNNHKAWMDAHRKEYLSIRNDFITWLDHLNLHFIETDPEYYPTPGKVAINRINNNLMFHPHKPVYKDHFGAGLDKAPGMTDFYIEIGLGTPCIAGGIWRPIPRKLRSIREGIDYNGDELVTLLEAPAFKKRFGGLYPDEKLTRIPKGYPSDHPHAEILKNKTFGVVVPITHDQILAPNFENMIHTIYREMLPFRRYINRTLTVETL